MAAFIPSRRDAAVNESALEKVADDKIREANDGFDGTWVAHPDLVPTARAEFDRVLAGRPNQVSRLRDDVSVDAAALLAVSETPGSVSEDGVRLNVSVGIQYIGSWLAGTGAAAINNLMEDAATAEISRTQLWQWIHHGARLADGRRVSAELFRAVLAEELRGAESDAHLAAAARLFDELATAPVLADFLTLPAYERLLDLSPSP
jgi:malate synthase